MVDDGGPGIGWRHNVGLRAGIRSRAAHARMRRAPARSAEGSVVTPYAGEPDDLSPYAKFAAPYDLNYVHPISIRVRVATSGAEELTEVRIGFLRTHRAQSGTVFGLRMLHGAQLAVEEANARGGYGGKPFRLMLHNDYDNWQAKTGLRRDRPTDPTIWGSASNEAVKMVYDDQDWAIFGSISSESTHIALRVALRAEIPDRQLGLHRSDHSRDLHSLVLHRSSG